MIRFLKTRYVNHFFYNIFIIRGLFHLKLYGKGRLIIFYISGFNSALEFILFDLVYGIYLNNFGSVKYTTYMKLLCCFFNGHFPAWILRSHSLITTKTLLYWANADKIGFSVFSSDSRKSVEFLHVVRILHICKRTKT